MCVIRLVAPRLRSAGTLATVEAPVEGPGVKRRRRAAAFPPHHGGVSSRVPLSVLVTADVHLGRTSSQAPGLPPARLRARHAWERLVGTAIERRVDALVVAGDLIDAENRRWEVLGPLVRDLDALCAAGIRVILTAGNHDWNSLPRLLEAIRADHGANDGQVSQVEARSPGVELLGSGGRWERTVLEANGERLAIDGWSFPTEAVTDDPVRGYALTPPAATPVLAVAHGEVGASGSRYAPIARTSLDGAGVEGWVVGHVHRPSLLELGRGFLLSPGSPQALDFGEPGPHGAWLINVAGGRLDRPRFVPLSAVRYEWLDIAMEGALASTEAERLAIEALTRLERRCLEESSEALEGLALRVRLCGRAAIGAAGQDAVNGRGGARRSHEDFARHIGQWQGASRLAVHVSEVVDELLPPVDLAALAAGADSSPLVATARLLVALADAHMDDVPRSTASAVHGPELDTLLREVSARLGAVDAESEYLHLAAAQSQDESGDSTTQSASTIDGHAADVGDGASSAPGRSIEDPARVALAAAARRVLASLIRQEDA